MSAELPAALAVTATAFTAAAMFGPFRKTAAASPRAARSRVRVSPPPWPTLIDAAAIDCDAAVRMEIADALGQVKSLWSESILRQAYAMEADVAVRSAIARAAA